MAVVLRFQSTGSIPGNGDPITMLGESLTIGRGSENDVVLPDPNRELSKRHCAIEDHNGNVIVVDFSTNGTFLNYGKLALGATPTPLNDGDILSIGPYEILVNIMAAEAANTIADPVADGPIGHGDAFAAPGRDDFLDAPGDGGDFLDDLLGGREAAPQGPRSVDRAEPDEDGLLPPLPGDEDLLGPAPDPYEGQGASAGMHNPSPSDYFNPAEIGGNMNAIPDDWDDDFLSPSGGGAAAPASMGQGLIPEPPVRAPQPATARRPAPQYADETTAPRGPATGGGDAAARAFLKALGADQEAVPDAHLTETMERMGETMRVFIEGIREILMTRNSIKSEFRIEQTMIQAGGNNPLKFSLSPDMAIEMMAKPTPKGYLAAPKAAEEALNDVKAHEVGMVTGMEAALKGILKRLDPAVLESQISADSSLTGMLKSRQARYWEVYLRMYSDISDKAENDFNELFAKEFARAYKDQLDKLK
ncbi:MAG: type VI secretion system-associated FHA domain protein TagH [Pseudomonadota bacterium]